MAIPDYSNSSTNKPKKLSKYEEQETDVSRMWKVRTEIVTVIIGALGTVKKGLDQNLQLLPAQRSATELQKITLMCTAQSVR
jgi:hypothetical protein